MTTSPIYGEAGRPLPAVATGNDSTLVGAFLPRHCRLSVRTAESLLSTIASSAARVETALAAARTADFTIVLAPGRRRQRAERTITSIWTSATFVRLRRGIAERVLLKIPSLRGGGLRPPCRRLRRSATPARD